MAEDPPPLKRRTLSTEHARVPVVTTRSDERPAETAPEAVIVLSGEARGEARRLAEGLGGLRDARAFAERGLPVPVETAPTVEAARQRAARLQAEGLPVEVVSLDNPTPPALTAAMVFAIPLIGALGVLLTPLVALPLLLAWLVVAFGAYGRSRSRIRESLALRDSQRSGEGPLDARLLALRRRLVQSELPEAAQRDLFAATAGLFGQDGPRLRGQLDEIEALIDAAAAPGGSHMDALDALLAQARAAIPGSSAASAERAASAEAEPPSGAAGDVGAAGEAERRRRAAQARRQRQ